MYCFSVSVDFQLRLLFVLEDRSSDESKIVLKSPPIKTGQFEMEEMEEKKL